MTASTASAALSFSISGLRKLGRSEVYRNLKTLLRDLLPRQGFAFLGNPLRHLTHPLLEKEAERKLDPTTRLLGCWRDLNEFTIHELQPALRAGKIAFTDGFGLDALLHAIACSTSESDKKAAKRVHRKLVEARILAQDISPPEYFIIDCEPEAIEHWMIRAESGLGDIDREDRRAYIEEQRSAIREYFAPGGGQCGHFFDGRQRHEEIASEIATFIVKRVEEANAQAA